MRNVLVSGIVLLLALTCSAQRYGNEWIDYSKQYYKFPISKEGVYRIDSTTLSKYYNLSTTNPKNFQLFLKGKEQFIYVKGESDGLINSGDYLEFYANNAMGDVDSLIYTNIKYVPNPYRGLFNDTIYAFLTLSNSVANKRYVLETDTNSIAYSPADYFYSQQVFMQVAAYNRGKTYFDLVTDPHYTQEEGLGVTFQKGSSVTSNFLPLLTYTGSAALPFYLTVNYSGMSIDKIASPDHEIALSYQDQNNATVQLGDTSFTGFVPVRQTFVLNPQSILPTTNFALTSISNTSLTGIANTTLLHYIRIFYPHTLNLNSQASYNLSINGALSGKKFYNFFNMYLTGSNNVLLFDLSSGKKISTVINGTNIRAVIPGTGSSKYFMVADAYTMAVNALSKVNESGYFTNFNKQVARDPYLIIYHPKLKASVTQYSDYRKSISGGSFDVITASTHELYEQFGYGINKHPLSIRNFIKFMKDSLSRKPAYVLLVGKGVNSMDLLPSYQIYNLLPTMGVPSSDNLYSAELSVPNNGRQEIPIGRIAAATDKDLSDYLLKVQQHESAPAAEWKKRVLHFVGGEDANLLNRLTVFMDGYKRSIEDTLYGGEVITFKKNTTQPIQTHLGDSVQNILMNGAALINFFGHGSAQVLDQAIDNPELFKNKGKYPFFIANSCYSGNVHIPGLRSISERFVFADQKGSIGFLATSSYGFDNSLDNYSNAFCKALSVSHYGQSIGKIAMEATNQNALSSDIPTTYVGLDMTLHGDPAIVIGNGGLPDYQLQNSDVNFDLKKYADSVGIKIRYKNIGRALRDSIALRIERYYPNGDSSTILRNIKAPYFKDSISVYMMIDFNRGIGLNRFKVFLDYFNKVNESVEINNSTTGTVDLFITGGDLLPVYPYKYAVVPLTATITLKSSTTDPFAPSYTYRMQLDTCDRFLNPIKSTLITSKGGVLEWNVNLPFKDSTVYYWRVSRDSTSPLSPFVWKESSFQTIGTKRGWSQAHFFQFKNDAYQFVKYKKQERKFSFENETHSIFCRNGIFPYIGDYSINYFFDGLQLSNWGCGPNGWNFAVFDSISGKPKKVRSLSFPSPGPNVDSACVCVGRELDFYSFGSANYCGFPNWKQNMEKFLNNIAPNQYVLAFTVGEGSSTYAQVSSYSNSLYSAFESIGAKTIRTTSDTVPYILFGRKGMAAGQGHEVKGSSKRSVIYLTDSIHTRWRDGYITSEIIGPSQKWNSLHWQVKSTDASAGDTTVLKLVGIKKNGLADTLQTFSEDSTNILALYNYVNADNYPYLKLVAYMRDNVHRTAPQLKRWQVLYDEAPECAINPLKGFASINDSLQEGDEVTFRFPIENIGMKNFEDSLVVTYWIEDNQRTKQLLPSSLKARPFKAGQVIVDTVKINSYQLKGNNTLWIYVNPVQNSRYQYEQSQFNNIGRYPFNVHADITNPLLDVTFDGIRILNGDIVSSKPTILITLKDENKFLALNDTSAFSVYLQAPDQSLQQRIYFAQGLQFTPAQLPKNSASITYNPVLTLDGKYTLMVQARDRSKNSSGASDYRIQFEVNTKPSVTSVLNYPNPFSTSTRFVFTITGSEIPEVFTIQIMTITGKIVREITRSELGYLHIGRNITEYAWDGRDNYGDKLANGVYLYRVITKLNGEDIEKNNTAADKYFVKEFGKMVLMR